MAIRNFETQTATVIGLLAFVVVLITLWLVVDMELDEEMGELVRAVLWGTGIGFGGLMLCIALAGLLA